jgi:hypothetical protein
MSLLKAKQRNALPSKDFAGPDRSYPIPDKSHARNALARASQFASAGEKEKIDAKVHSKFPSIGKGKSSMMKRLTGK